MDFNCLFITSGRQHPAHCTLHTVHYTLHLDLDLYLNMHMYTSYYTLDTANHTFILHVAHSSLHTVYTHIVKLELKMVVAN